jgi:phage terminase large subunit-like protein
VSQSLEKKGLHITEFPQTSPNLTLASQNLYDLVVGRNLLMYPNADIRLAVSRAVAIETSRGWRIAKEKQSHKVDVVVALAMAAYAAVMSAREPADPPIVAPVVLDRHGVDVSAVLPDVGRALGGPRYSMRDSWSPRW